MSHEGVNPGGIRPSTNALGIVDWLQERDVLSSLLNDLGHAAGLSQASQDTRRQTQEAIRTTVERLTGGATSVEFTPVPVKEPGHAYPGSFAAAEDMVLVPQLTGDPNAPRVLPDSVQAAPETYGGFSDGSLEAKTSFEELARGETDKHSGQSAAEVAQDLASSPAATTTGASTGASTGCKAAGAGLGVLLAALALVGVLLALLFGGDED